MKKQNGMTLLEVMVALIFFSLIGIAFSHVTIQQIDGLERMRKKILANWLADNQMTQLYLDNIWLTKFEDEKYVNFAGIEWYVRWYSYKHDIPKSLILYVEVKNNKEDEIAIISIHSYVIHE
ncbi:TPA: type II secretion system minor pseudopilin GspI [Escherichia coli]|nr:type II secretion system minor pseudopilin GspI [Escherichia coli]HAW4130617.1 type II secretion system minor pseudopilin GspI [Escherichia coli]HAW4140544.1 type II secretion system minor pseudopilin GspI [Escherichia coli]